jgi:hypothetical protein
MFAILAAHEGGFFTVLGVLFGLVTAGGFVTLSLSEAKGTADAIESIGFGVVIFCLCVYTGYSIDFGVVPR